MSYYNPYDIYNNYFLNDELSREYKNDEDNKMTIEGKGVVKARPDIGLISIGVVSQGKDLKNIQQENADKTNKVIESLIKMGVDDKDIKTENYNITPEYDFIDGKQIFKGYKVTNNLRITIRDLKGMGQIIDTAVDNGANNINSINFTLSDPRKYYLEALKIAYHDSLLKARTLAATMKVELNTTPISIVEQEQGSVPFGQISMKMLASATPIEPGQIEINAILTVIFIYKSA